MFENIVEICVAIDIAILGIAYPIMIDKISNIGEKYNSHYLSNVFNTEFPQKPFKYQWGKRKKEISYFKLCLYLTILSFLPLIVSAEPWFECEYDIINNSADYIVLLMTFALTISFFWWLDIVVRYNGKATSLLQHLIGGYKNVESENDYKFKAVNEFAVYAIDKQDAHLQNTLLEFYYTTITNIRRKHDRAKPLIYPVDIYEMVYRVCFKLVNTDNKDLLALEHRAVSGIWFLGEDFEQIEISNETYSWLWRILNTIVERDKFIRMYWGTAHQYYDFKLRHKTPEYNQVLEILNKEMVDNRIRERDKFLKFNLALGGLLLYRKQFQTLNYIFHYTQSQPPSYVLLPENSTIIFKWFEFFSNEFKNMDEPIDYKFYFHGLDNMGIRREVGYWICSYMALLFIRLHSLQQFYVFQDFTAQPNLPDKIYDLRDWLRAVPFFERCLQQLISNEELMSELGLKKVVEENKDVFFEFVQELKKRIEIEIESKHINAELSDQKIEEFNISSTQIITDAFSEYDHIANTGEYIENENDLKLTVTGSTILASKSSFIEDTGVAHLNFDSVLADGIAGQIIRRYIPNSFLSARTRRYLLNHENILTGIERLLGDRDDIIIVAINLHHESKKVLEPYNARLREIRATEHRLQNMLFVLKESDLPFFLHKEFDDARIKAERLHLLDSNLNIYSAILDLSKDDNFFAKEKWSEEDLQGDISVQLTIDFLTLIIYKNQREIVQVNIASKFKEQGIQNSLDEINPIE